jgi:hypothetical protein
MGEFPLKTEPQEAGSSWAQASPFFLSVSIVAALKSSRLSKSARSRASCCNQAAYFIGKPSAL